MSDLVPVPPNLNGTVTNNLFCFRQCGIIVRQCANHTSRGVAIFVENKETIGEQSAILSADRLCESPAARSGRATVAGHREPVCSSHADLWDQLHARICDPAHFAYPTYAKAARERRAKLQRSADALRIELDRLRFEATETPNQQFAA